MLILSRHKDEQIIIGEGPDAVTVTVVDVRGDKVRLGIEAPRIMPVHRREVAEKIERDGKRKKSVKVNQKGISDHAGIRH